ASVTVIVQCHDWLCHKLGFVTFTCKRSLVRMRKLQLRLRSRLWKSLAIYVLSSALRIEISADSISEFPALSAGAGTWVCGNRKTTQMVTALCWGMQVDCEGGCRPLATGFQLEFV